MTTPFCFVPLKNAWMFFILLILCGCQSSQDEPAPQVEIESSFLLNFRETLDTLQPTLFCLLESIEEFPCTNYSIEYQWTRQNDQLKLSLSELTAPPDCLPGNGPALDSVDWGFFEEGEYALEINLKEAVFNEGALLVSPDEYSFLLNSLDGILLKHIRYNRIPRGTFWGYVGYSDPSQDTLVQNLLEDLKDLDSGRYFTPGYYGYFSIKDTSREVALIEPEPYPYQETFLVHLRSDAHTPLQALIDQYRANYSGQITIGVFTYWGAEW